MLEVMWKKAVIGIPPENKQDRTCSDAHYPHATCDGERIGRFIPKVGADGHQLSAGFRRQRLAIYRMVTGLGECFPGHRRKVFEPWQHLAHHDLA